ncbi:MAG: tetratricopeptide repeat protein [Gemmatimonadota bacterium]|nr:tetratricopeptide repeat protein [Gemmatimonadota bacterium]
MNDSPGVKTHVPGCRILLTSRFIRLCLPFILSLWIVSSAAAAESGYLDGMIGELLQLNFSGRNTECFERVQSLLAADPTDYRAYYIRADCYNWFIAANPENRRYDNQIVESLKACVEHSSSVESSSPEYSRALFFKAMALVTGAQFRQVRGKRLTARWATRQAREAAEELATLVPQNIDAWLPLAIFHYYWGGSSVWMRAAQFITLVPRGKRELGLSLLEDCAAKGNDSRPWAGRSLLGIYTADDTYTEQAMELALRMHESYPENAVIHLILGDCYRNLERWEQAEMVYRNITGKVLRRISSYNEVVFEISRLRTVESQVRLGKIQEAFAGVKSILISNPMSPEWIVPRAHLFAAQIYRHQGQWKRAERACRYARDSRDHENLHDMAKEEQKAIEKARKE